MRTNKTVTLREIASEVGMTYSNLAHLRHNKQWPWGFPPLNKNKRGKAGELLFDSAVIDAVKRKHAGLIKRQQAKHAQDVKETKGILSIVIDEAVTLAPATHTLESIAIKLIKANYDEAGLWLLKQQ